MYTFFDLFFRPAGDRSFFLLVAVGASSGSDSTTLDDVSPRCLLFFAAAAMALELRASSFAASAGVLCFSTFTFFDTGVGWASAFATSAGVLCFSTFTFFDTGVGESTVLGFGSGVSEGNDATVVGATGFRTARTAADDASSSASVASSSSCSFSAASPASGVKCVRLSLLAYINVL
jgi:hypothetical protein